MEHLAVQLIVAMIAAQAANVLIPRRIPGRFLGLLLTGLVGVWLGEVGFKLLKAHGITSSVLYWGILGVPLIPSIVGSVLVLLVVTTVFRQGRYI